MYTVTVSTGFSATHRVTLESGELEPLHGHDWHVRAQFTSDSLNPRGMVVDFLDAKKTLLAIVADWNHRDLNRSGDFADQEPTAETVARTIHDRLARAGFDNVHRVEVTESPGCTAAYETPHRWPNPV